MPTTRRTTSARLRAPLAVGALLLPALLVGCTGGGSDAARQGGPAGGGGRPSATPPAPGRTVAPLRAVASRTVSASRTSVEVTLNEVRVDGKVTTVTWTARPVSGDDRWQVANFFSNGVKDSGLDGSFADYETADGVYLVDSVHAKRYLVARDPRGLCVCSGGLSTTFANPETGVVLTATFRALPEDVTAVNVVIPKAGTFAQVPVAR